ncbi:MAG: CYTH domain-containing protein [Clostridia bacterium]|nr:CYTH domain-containing protein [Clostridia bacterium]
MDNSVKIIIVLVVLVIVVEIGVIAIMKANQKGSKSKSYDERIDEVLADDKEIERKWLVDKNSIPYDLSAKDVEVYDIKQTYFSFNPEMRVRNYNNGMAYEMTIKDNMSADGLVRDEVNITINKEQYENLIQKQEGNTIHKTRYQLYDDGQVLAFDIFHDSLDGLAYMEIEFASEEESRAYKEPEWVIKDVTDNKNYKNGHLARYGIPADE